MNAVQVRITAFADNGQPGWVACEMIDANGVIHHFMEKVPVVSNEDLRHDSAFPRDGSIACAVNSIWTDELGRDLSKIDTSQPWGVESKAGITEFVVLSSTIHSTQ
jgi:hypothetical protein